MAQDWMADVRKYVPHADDAHVNGIVRHCGIALHKPDSAMVSMSDPKETARVREGFCKKKLGLTHSDAELDSAIAEVGQRMKEDRTKNRVTVYYLLAEKYGKLRLFEKAASTKGVAKGSASAIGAAAVGAGAAALGGTRSGETISSAPAVTPIAAAPPPPPRPDPVVASQSAPSPAVPSAPVASAVPVTAATSAAFASSGSVATRSAAPAGAFDWRRDGNRRFIGSVGDGDGRDVGAVAWLVPLALGLIFLLFWLALGHRSAPDTTTAVAPVAAAPTSTAVDSTGSVVPSAAPQAAASIPSGAGVTSGTRDGRPEVTVYFDAGKSIVAPAFAAAAAGLKTYLGAHDGSKLAVSGFNDKTGNAAANAILSKNRAKAVQAALVAAGIPAGAIELAKPSDTTDTATTNESARRVEVSVK